MRHSSIRKRRLLQRIALGLAAAAMAAPAALANQGHGIPHEPSTIGIAGGTGSAGGLFELQRPAQDWQLRYGTGTGGGHSPGGPAYGVPVTRVAGQIHPLAGTSHPLTGTSPQAELGGPRPVGVIGYRSGGQLPEGGLDRPGTPVAVTPSAPIRVVDGGFDWVAAAIGASFALGIGLLAAAMLAARRRGRLAHS